MDEALIRLASDSGILTSVHGLRSGTGYQELAFAFERGTLHLSCDTDCDEVVASAGTTVSELPEVGELASLAGKVIEQAWTMKNNRGFQDGFQLQCIDLDTRAEVCVQVEAAAGVLMLFQVAPLG